MQVIVAAGRNAFSVKESLKTMGFKWYRQEKLWVSNNEVTTSLRTAIETLRLTLETYEIPDAVGAELFARRSRSAAQAAVEALAEPAAPTPAPDAPVAPAATPAPSATVSSMDRARAAAARATEARTVVPCAPAAQAVHAVAVAQAAPVEVQLAALKAQARTMRALMVEIELTIESLEQKLKA